MHLLDKQNYVIYLGVGGGGLSYLSAFCLKQVKWSSSGVSKIFLNIYSYPTGS